MNTRVVLLIFLAAFAVRAVGLFRGLETGASFHPDVAKQVVAVANYLEGRYVWYTGSLAYDGYPYGLNHIDEWIIRATWPAARAASAFLQPGLELARMPDQTTLHYLCTALRVGYGLLALAAFLWALVRAGIPERQRWAWLLLAALSPVLSAVTHSASGDVGTDLFVMLALAFVARARGGDLHRRDFLLGGLALGMAFACKYHGVLGALAPGLFLLLAPVTWRQRIQTGLWLAAGLLAGFAVLTPHVFFDTQRTLEHIWLNFHYIKNYNVPESFRALPFLERSGISLAQNLPVVAGALGLGATVLALTAGGLLARRLLRGRAHETAWDFAAVAMPFLVLALALIGKPALQPFHFSFLPMPLLLGAALGWRHAGPRLRLALPVLLVIAAVEYGVQQRREWMFWSREDVRVIATRLGGELVQAAAPGERMRTAAMLRVEGPNMAVFRNRPSAVKIAEPRDWVEHPDDRLPATPWPGSPDWIFADLPAFPRESRLVVLPPGRPVSRIAVGMDPEADLAFHFQAGSRDAEVRTRIAGRSHRFTLAPGESRTVIAPAETGSAFARDDFAGRRFSFRAEARGAPVLLRVGPSPDVAPDADRAARKLARAHFVDGVRPGDSGVVALRDALVLTPGHYALEVDAPRVTTPMTLVLRDTVVDHPARVRRLPLVRTNGLWRAEWRHTADYLFSGLHLETVHPLPYELPWRIRPLAALPEDPEPPAQAAWTPAHGFGGGRWIFGNIEAPDRIARGAPLQIHLRMAADASVREQVREYAAFIHLLDRAGRQVFARDIPLAGIGSHLGGPAPAHDLGPLDLPPGDYEILLGLYHPRSDTRIRPDETHRRDRRVVLGTLTVTGSESAP